MYIYIFLLVTLATKVCSIDKNGGYIEKNAEYCLNKYIHDTHVTDRLNTSEEIWENKKLLHEDACTEKRTNTKITKRKVNREILSMIPGLNQLVSFDDPDSETCPTSSDANAVSLYKDLYNDPLWVYEWYLHDCRQPGSTEPYDNINVVRAWKEYKVFGKGIIVVVSDDGVQWNHPDLKDNFSMEYSYDFIAKRPDPSPVSTPDDPCNHGTEVAGVIAMVKNNYVCGVGVAPDVTLGALRIIGERKLYDHEEADAFLFKKDEVHINTNAWVTGDAKEMPKLGPRVAEALKIGVTEGRQKKGTIYVFGAGNDKAKQSTCASNPFANSMYTIIAASAAWGGKVTDYSERCAAVMITAYSGGGVTSSMGAVSTDLNSKCTQGFSGTSAATAFISGGIALALEVNPKLTWRDMHHLLAASAQISPFRNNRSYKGWIRNKGGFYFSPDFGFGMMDVYILVTMASSFVSVPPMATCTYHAVDSRYPDKELYRESVKVIEANTDACAGSVSEVNYAEHVQIVTTIKYTKRGDLQIMLESPSGTKVPILEHREHDDNNMLDDYTFDSLHAWGENPRGTWKIYIFDKTGPSHNNGYVYDLKLIINGTKDRPAHYNNCECTGVRFTKKNTQPDNTATIIKNI